MCAALSRWTVEVFTSVGHIKAEREFLAGGFVVTSDVEEVWFKVDVEEGGVYVGDGLEHELQLLVLCQENIYLSFLNFFFFSLTT